MTHAEAFRKIEELRKKGWFFSLKADKAAWDCYVLGPGLSFGKFFSPDIGKAVEKAIAQATAMVDDPKVVIKAHGAKIKKLVEKFFGKGNFISLDAVEWEPEEPRRLCIWVKGDHRSHIAESSFFKKAAKSVPVDVLRSLVFEVEWPEEAKK